MNKKDKQELKLATTYLWLQRAVDGGLLKCVEKKNTNQESIHFKKANFDHETCNITIELDNGTVKTIKLPENYGIEMVDPEKNPDYQGYQRMGVWDYNNMYCFDAKF